MITMDKKNKKTPLVKYRMEKYVNQGTNRQQLPPIKVKDVRKREVSEWENQGYIFVRKEYFIFTPVKKWLNNLSDLNKIALAAVIVAFFVIIYLVGSVE